MTAAAWITWAAVAWCLVCAVAATHLYRRARRHARVLQRYWQQQAPPVPPVRVLLKTGEVLDVQPTEVQQTWTWWVRVPHPSLVQEVELPDLPPWTSVLPMPADWPKP